MVFENSLSCVLSHVIQLPPLLQRDHTALPTLAPPSFQECDLAKDRSFDMSSVEGAEPLDPKAGLEKLLRELGDVTCDYSINPP